MTIPSLLQILTLDEIIAENKALFETNNPGVLESESDYYMPVIEAWSEREFRMRTEVNYNFKQHFWIEASDGGLDWGASFFGMSRLEGSKPWATFSFILSEIKEIETRIPIGFLLGDENGNTARTKEEVVIAAGQLTATALGELDLYVESSSIKTEQVLTPLPYLIEVLQAESFHGGREIETDEALRNRIGLSLETLSGAGPRKAYKKRTLDADSRIKDVNVFEIDGRVQIVIDTDTWDALLVQRVTDAIGAEEVRPLNDNIDIYQATVLPFNIVATLAIKEGYNALDVVSMSKEACEKLRDLKIEDSISLARVIESLFVEGVNDVAVASPATNLSASRTEVLRLETIEVSYA